jgi:hypothetical protein
VFKNEKRKGVATAESPFSFFHFFPLVFSGVQNKFLSENFPGQNKGMFRFVSGIFPKYVRSLSRVKIIILKSFERNFFRRLKMKGLGFAARLLAAMLLCAPRATDSGVPRPPAASEGIDVERQGVLRGGGRRIVGGSAVASSSNLYPWTTKIKYGGGVVVRCRWHTRVHGGCRCQWRACVHRGSHLARIPPP